MKFILAFLVLFSTSVFAVTKFETHCKDADCFKNGWITTAKNYTLDTVCKNNDCSKYGWSSVANDNSTYEVTCRSGGCFKKGWYSTQEVNDSLYHDDVTCAAGNCLRYGWTVKTGYDLMGGNVRCNANDCSKFGGTSYWRGRPSETMCYDYDCYHNGWDWYVY